jgi:hypothetical protein
LLRIVCASAAGNPTVVVWHRRRERPARDALVDGRPAQTDPALDFGAAE